MKNCVRFAGKVKVLFTFALLFLVLNSFSGSIDLNNNYQNQFQVTENTYSQLRVENTIGSMDFFEVKSPMGYFTMLNLADYGYTLVPGDPKLPVLKRLIEVPLNAGIKITILNEHFQEILLSEYGISNYLMPAQPPMSKSIENPEDVEFVYNSGTYAMNQYLGNELVTVKDLGIMRGVRIFRLEIAPFQYNPVQHTLKIYDNLDISVTFTNGDAAGTINLKKEKFSPFFEGIYSSLINYKPVESKDLIMDEPVTYLIVSAPMFETALQPFIQWKTKKGFNVIEGYTDDPAVGTTTTSIKNYIQGIYNNPPSGMNPPSFVLLVGDVPQIPAWNGQASSHVTDLYYFEYTGDLFPEIYYGRFSANNETQLQPQIDKTLEYEQYLFPDPSFLDEVVMVAGADGGHQTWSNGQINYGTTYYFNAAHGLESHTYLQPEPGGGNYSQNIRQNVSDGVAYGNYTAHCSPDGWADPSFVINHIPALTNNHKYGLLVGNCCSSVEFQTTCFGEEILRAANKGALGYIGGSNSTYWDEDYWWGVGFKTVTLNPPYDATKLGAYDRTFHDHGEPLDEWYVTQGQMIPAGNLAVSQSGSMEQYYWEIYHLMGDPSVMIYFSQPPDIIANYQGLMPLGSASFTVNTDPYAYVAISKDGVLHGAAIADATGVAEVTMFDPITVPGNADVVITKQNGRPYIGTVVVASPAGPYVLFEELTINDASGNNNGQADYSENILLNVTLQNFGNSAATSVVAEISTTDQYVTITDATQNWPDIPASSSSTQNNAFAFTVDNTIPDQHVSQFDMEITDGVNTWNCSFNITLNAPLLTIGNFTIDDATGNNNGRLDPGETVNLIISNTNEGHSDAINATGQISSTSNILTINNGTFNLNTLQVGETTDAIFNVTVSNTAQIGDVISIDYDLASNYYSANSTITLTVGIMVEDFETGNFNSYEWEMGGNADWTIDQVAPYEGVYSAKSGDIDDYETSTLSITVTVTADDEISFFKKVSSEANYDYLKFYIDNSLLDEWAGDVPWSEATFPVTAGEHTFKWEYYKDVSVSTGSDAVWVDFIVFPPFSGGPAPLAVYASASPASICEEESSQLNAFATGGTGTYTYSWTPATGLSNPNISNPVATPEETITYTVAVNDGSNTVTDEITVEVNANPPTPEITQQGNTLVSSSATGNQWYNAAGLIPGATGQIYMPTATDDYYVIVTNQFGCESDASNTFHFIYTGVNEFSDNLVRLFPNPFRDKLVVDYMINGSSRVSINVYDAYGVHVTALVSEETKSSGIHRAVLNSSGLNSGVYYIRIQTEQYSLVKEVVLNK